MHCRFFTDKRYINVLQECHGFALAKGWGQGTQGCMMAHRLEPAGPECDKGQSKSPPESDTDNCCKGVAALTALGWRAPQQEQLGTERIQSPQSCSHGAPLAQWHRSMYSCSCTIPRDFPFTGVILYCCKNHVFQTMLWKPHLWYFRSARGSNGHVGVRVKIWVRICLYLLTKLNIKF